ncbi:protein translocase subunit SecF [Treponema sp. OMZ 792]|uniref:protein translocase subunit SecF n=1 Tax=unclassified Treponema TaxID=2638727 RepID=UPI0020A25945|nr:MULTISPECIES: protein translocase subunit SecF [unclassified Treponema]UTC75250.1 protein translocase subunit SecF [Treponema sp. OMZ 792]UTC78954.1 protein translocase subunit SecF [Treponema sp. OMZ 799]UTC79255.1 protein translocase subunit SecF [Treponema sp. OMZ 798]
MKKVISFSKFFVPGVIISIGLMTFGIIGYFTKGINFGIDFQAGFIEKIKIAPTAVELSYEGPLTVSFSQGISDISITTTSLDAENKSYVFKFADNPTLKDFADGIASIEGLKVKINASANTLLKDLFTDSESSPRLSQEIFRLHYLDKNLKPISTDEVRHALSSIPSVSVQQLGTPEDRYFQIRLADDGKYENANKELRSIITSALNAAYGTENIAVMGTDFVGSRFSSSLAKQAILLVGGALVLIFVYAMFRFQWNFSVAAILALLHDTMVMVMFISWTQMEFNSTTIAAILTIIGYSINDTIVIFDRIREKIHLEPRLECNEVLDKALTEVFTRTIITTMTTMVAVVALYVFTTDAMKDFALALIVGLISGTYSSIYIASYFIAATSKGKKAGEMITRGKKAPGELSGAVI